MGGRPAWGGGNSGGRIGLAPGAGGGGGGGVGKGKRERIECPRCGATMTRMQACHLLCTRCGANLDCSDKGTFW